MTAAEISIVVALAGTVIASAAAVIGVQIKLMAPIVDKLDAVASRVQVLDAWHDRWAPMPDDSSNAVQLDRRLTRIEHRLDQIEHHMNHHSQEHPDGP